MDIEIIGATNANRFYVKRDGQLMIGEDGKAKFYYKRAEAEALARLLALGAPAKGV